MTQVDDEPRTADWREITALLLLSITAILTAWCGFQSSKWGGAMSISFSQASSARIEASRSDGDANRSLSIQVGLFTQWLAAYQSGDQTLADFLRARFPDPLSPAFEAWVKTEPTKNPDAPATPFDMPEYVLPAVAAAQDADHRADAKFQEALDNNQRGDNYTILTVLYATVLFFTAVSQRIGSQRAQMAMMGVALIGFLVATGVLLSYPRLI